MFQGDKPDYFGILPKELLFPITIAVGIIDVGSLFKLLCVNKDFYSFVQVALAEAFKYNVSIESINNQDFLTIQPTWADWKWMLESIMVVTKEDFNGIGRLPNLQYRGDIAAGKPHGKGVLIDTYGYLYIGDVVGGLKEGQGKWYNGKDLNKLELIYDGQYLNNKRHGFGTYYYTNHSEYTGNWEANFKKGFGRITWESCAFLEGYFDGEINGQAVYQWPCKNKFEGLYLGDTRDGTFYEKATDRTFHYNDSHLTSHQLDTSVLHPDIQVCYNDQPRHCTYSVTQENCYFQYSWKIGEKTFDGVCWPCKEHCIVQNELKLLDPSPRFSGNVYCVCGAGKLGKPCRLMNNKDA